MTADPPDIAGSGSLPLAGRTALVAGGTRGAGRGIAVQLGAAGATVVVSGRSTREGRSDLNRPETIEETAELVTSAGGRGIPIRCDHSDPAQVEALVRQVREHGDGLDILVNDIWGGDALIEWKPVWEHDLDRGLTAFRRAIETHVITSHHALPLLLERARKPSATNSTERRGDERTEWSATREPPAGAATRREGGVVGDEGAARAVNEGRSATNSTERASSTSAATDTAAGGQGLLVEITDGDEQTNALFPDSYRGGFFYDLIKKTVIQLARTQAAELRPYGVAAVALTPGFLRSEEVLDHFGVTEANWRDAIATDPHFAYSETPAYIGRAVAALAADPNVLDRTGESLNVAHLAKEYGFTDSDGTQPDFASYFAEKLVPQLTEILRAARESG